MENINRKVRLFFVSYGKILFRIIGVIALIIIAVQTLNKMAIEKREEEKMKYINYKANNSINSERNNI